MISLHNIILLVVGFGVYLAFMVTLDLHPRLLDPLIHFPFRDMPGTNAALVGAAVLCTGWVVAWCLS